MMKKLAISLLLMGLVSCEPEAQQFIYENYTKEYRDTLDNIYQKDLYSLKMKNGWAVNIIKKRIFEDYNTTDKILYNGNVFEKSILGDTIQYKISIYHLDSNNNFIFENIKVKVVKQNNQIIDIIE